MEGDKAISFGIENPSRYVLKPEREGGGKLINFAPMKYHKILLQYLQLYFSFYISYL